LTGVVGTSVKRTEDARFTTGTGSFLDDIKLSGMSRAVILRSPYAHARIVSIDTSAAETMPGVLAVFTGKDLAEIPPLPCAWPAGGADGPYTNNLNTPRLLALDDVKWTGEGLAMVIAESPEQAADAVEAIVIDLEELPVVVDSEAAMADGAPQLHENAAGNMAFEWWNGDKEGTEAALERAEVVVTQRLINQRLIPTPMEVRGAIGRFDPGTDEYTIWMTSQAPHVMRLLITAFVLGIPENKVRVISPDIGGAFGSKIFLYTEWVLVAWASKQLGGRPVKFVESRRENFVATTHGRDHVTDVRIAGTRDGRVTALHVKTLANMGGRLSTIGPGTATTLYGRVLTGPYAIPDAYVEVTGVYTNTAYVDAYRGAGRPEATYVIERAMDLFAAEIQMDRAELRRRNFLPKDSFPYHNPSGMYRSWNGEEVAIDSGDYEPALEKALKMAGYAERDATREAAMARGKYLGLGLSSYVEICGAAPSKWIGAVGEGWGAAMWESANIRIHLTGKVTVTTGSQTQGQGLETTMAQVAASELGVPMDDVLVEHSDTLGTPFGYGTYASRSAAVGATAIVRAAEKIRRKAALVAAHLLEAAVEDIVHEDGKYFVKGAPAKAKTIAEIAFATDLGFDLPAGVEPFLDETAYYDAENCTWPFGTHVAIVEVDAETGHVDLIRYVAVDDVATRSTP
jgi:carbon-monoxide dehydrogenase large subunit